MSKYKLKDLSEVLGKCYICGCNVTINMISHGKGVCIGKNTYRCRRKLCEYKVVDDFLKTQNIKFVRNMNEI